MSKKKIGVYSFTSCSGCQIAILNLEDALVDILSKFDIRYFHLIQAKNKEEPVDIAFIEGAITTKKQVEKLNKLREMSGVMVAMGSCACTGGIPAMKNETSREKLRLDVYGKKRHHLSQQAQPIDKYVHVDYYLRGCPMVKEEFTELVLSLLNEKEPYQRPYPVCTECRLKENPCLIEQGKLCLGPLAYMGCNAPCPSQGQPCVACRGLHDDTRLEAFIKLMEKKNISKKEIQHVFKKYVEEKMK
ncbi:MAG: hypothetical protein R6V53_06180 [Candidatus Woesearchaeota archaeon]